MSLIHSTIYLFYLLHVLLFICVCFCLNTLQIVSNKLSLQQYLSNVAILYTLFLHFRFFGMRVWHTMLAVRSVEFANTTEYKRCRSKNLCGVTTCFSTSDTSHIPLDTGYINIYIYNMHYTHMLCVRKISTR